ncbi:MAG: YbaB/EbfC family nucleoid-associated protein [Clostridia bacterium]|nr:YbaB/EbfC family nucleoid-associated protein [Clostridia bacterium]
MAYGKGGFGGFGGNQMQQLMKQAQKMQEDMKKANEQLDEMEIVGEAAGGAVKVTVNGKKIMTAVNVDPSVVDPDDVEMLEDLILAAYGSASEKADAEYERLMGPYTKMGGMF